MNESLPQNNLVLRVILLLGVMFSFPFTHYLHAQVVGDLCDNPIQIDSLLNQCSPEGFYDLSNFSSSPIDNPRCYPEGSNQNDVWFQFVNTFENINIIVRGDVGQGKGGTLRSPQFTVYKGSCGSLETVSCISDFSGFNFEEMTLGDLEIGATYLIRVGSRANHQGSFQLCVSNFSYTPEYDSDCPTATVLCDKSTLVVQQLSGTGRLSDEADNTCLDIDPSTNQDDGNSEVSSVWFKWVARNDGDLTFVLDPINPTDDLDFAVFELPGGIDDCANKQVLRCMASGEVVGADFPVWQPCTGPTGLASGSTDILEWRGCDSGDDNFLAPLQMEAGKAYALVVNNFSNRGKGFRLSWGGSGDFSTPDAAIIFDNPKELYCPNDPIQFQAIDRSASGSIVSYEWNVDNQELSGAGPHQVSFTTGGRKPIVLNLESDIGCISPIDTFIMVEDPMEVTATIDPISCNGYDDGQIDLTVNSPSPVDWVLWDDGSPLTSRDSLAPGVYTVTVQNQNGCSVEESYELIEPLPISIDEIITNASCGGGMDGRIEIIAAGSFPPFQFDFMDGQGLTNDNVRDNLKSGIYVVNTVDAMGCSHDTTLYLNEINFNIRNSQLTEPLCYGDANGSIEFVVTGGRPSYEFDYNLDGNFTTNPVLNNIPAGDYVILIRDQDLCQGYVDTTLLQPDSLSLTSEKSNISCYGETDGQLHIFVEGGIPDYQYQWNNGASTSSIIELREATYVVLVEDANGCQLSRNFDISEPPPVQIDLIDKRDLLCFGDQDGFIIVDGMGGTGNLSYQISGHSDPGPDFQGLGAGEYILTLIDENQCKDSILVELTQPDELSVAIVGDTTLNLGEQVELLAVAQPDDRTMTWLWEPSEQVTCDTCEQVLAQPRSSTSFTLTGTDQNGCEAFDQIQFLVYPIRDVGVPNVLNPQSDGPNGTVTVYAGPHVSGILDFNVFDRWGNLLYSKQNFEPNDFTLGWNGKANGTDMMPGIYVYTAEILYLDGVTQLISGEILLLN